MSLCDCEKCFDSPCTCGYQYRNMTEGQFYKFIVDITKGRHDYIKQEAEEAEGWLEEDFTINVDDSLFKCRCGNETFKKNEEQMLYKCNKCSSIFKANIQ
jgi:DNA-directed RNA polymerase subunit RPC12/RpoP